jgi:hypothetical protein
MYTNIPRAETTNIIHNILKTKQTTKQNYFQFQQHYFKETEGLAMGAPPSAILAEAYIQNMEHKQIYPVLLNHKIIGYFRYVDDILTSS